MTQYQSPDKTNTLIKNQRKFQNTVYEIYDQLQLHFPDTFVKPMKDELVIQLRLGDVIEHKWYFKKNYIDLIEQHIIKFKITKISFVTAFFFANVTTNTNQQIFMYSEEKFEKNKMHVNKLLCSIHKYFPQISLNIVSNYNPDIDMFYLIHANYLITELGGFGDFAKNVRNNPHDI